MFSVSRIPENIFLVSLSYCYFLKRHCVLRQTVNCEKHLTNWLLIVQGNLKFLGEMWMKKCKKHESHKFFLILAVGFNGEDLQRKLKKTVIYLVMIVI